MNNSGQPINNFQGQPNMYPGAQGGYIPGRVTPQTAKKQKKSRSGLIKTICLIFVSLLAVTFFVLFVLMRIEYDDFKKGADQEKELAIATAKNELQAQLESQFEEREKYPYKTFTGPTDYGQVTFEYPKTWNLYIPNDASHGGDFEAYFNPGQVNVVSGSTIMALRFRINSSKTEDVIQEYADRVKAGLMTVSTITINEQPVDVYSGELGNDDYKGVVCIFKIRDKTVMLRTDAMLFADDFYRLIEKIRFNA